MRQYLSVLLAFIVFVMPTVGQETFLPKIEKISNYLPHMTTVEVRNLLKRSDMVIIPVGALEQHGPHLPIGTDFLNGLERAKLIGIAGDILVAPILFPGQSPYHMGFKGTITLPSTLIQEVYLEATKSLIQHGFKKFLILNAHGGNAAITRFIVDRINQETAGIAVDLVSAVGPLIEGNTNISDSGETDQQLDRHAGTPETSNSMYLIPELVDLDNAIVADVSLPDHLASMLPLVLEGDPVARSVFLAEGLKSESTGKGTSAIEMTTTGVWGDRNPNESTSERGRLNTESFVNASVHFIDRWNALRPIGIP